MRIFTPSHLKRSAFATAAIFILLLAASAVTLTTVAMFRNLHHELRFTEKKQQEHWNKVVIGSAPTTNTSNSRIVVQSSKLVAERARP